LREKALGIGKTDKVFASEWITEEEVVVGTKCNKLFIVNTVNDSTIDIPRLQLDRSDNTATSCGIHTISTSEERKYLATGGANPTHLAIYGLPEMQPLAIGEGHTDWLFDAQWITDTLLITGARDSQMALWSVVSLDQSEDSDGEENSPLAENVSKLEPIIKFSNLTSDVNVTSHCERVRNLAYSRDSYTLASLQTNACGGIVHFWDLFTFLQTAQVELPFCAENVCLEFDDNSGHMFGVGSRSHVTFLDDRVPAATVGSLKSLDIDCGVRSLRFNCNLLSIGTGAGHIYFYDMRSRRYLNSTKQGRSGKPVALSLETSTGWLRRDDTYRSFFSGFPEPLNAVYTHCYSPTRTKLFAAGGPLPLGLYGNYAGVWV
jgi:WD repeat-containing protein 40A